MKRQGHTAGARRREQEAGQQARCENSRSRVHSSGDCSLEAHLQATLCSPDTLSPSTDPSLYAHSRVIPLLCISPSFTLNRIFPPFAPMSPSLRGLLTPLTLLLFVALALATPARAYNCDSNCDNISDVCLQSPNYPCGVKRCHGVPCGVIWCDGAVVCSPNPEKGLCNAARSADCANREAAILSARLAAEAARQREQLVAEAVQQRDRAVQSVSLSLAAVRDDVSTVASRELTNLRAQAASLPAEARAELARQSDELQAAAERLGTDAVTQLKSAAITALVNAFPVLKLAQWALLAEALGESLASFNAFRARVASLLAVANREASYVRAWVLDHGDAVVDEMDMYARGIFTPFQRPGVRELLNLDSIVEPAQSVMAAVMRQVRTGMKALQEAALVSNQVETAVQSGEAVVERVKAQWASDIEHELREAAKAAGQEFAAAILAKLVVG